MKRLLSPVLALVGLAVMVLGLDAGLGGMRTLGWFIAPDFVSISNPENFAVQDSHARFLGAMWFGTGLVFLAGSIWRARLTDTLIILCALVALAGLFRLLAPVPADVLGSITLEIIGFPLLAFWLHKSRI